MTARWTVERLSPRRPEATPPCIRCGGRYPEVEASSSLGQVRRYHLDCLVADLGWDWTTDDDDEGPLERPKGRMA